MELKRIKLQLKLKRIETQTRDEGGSLGPPSETFVEVEDNVDQVSQRVMFNDSRLKGPKMATFDEKD